ncbi:ubiquitin carboxyl-terminal hydrolase 8 [Galendromus occidentalis]|uniref:ubiquitinyl hydrolase 1 n=1 Tax=Galendromus occidentalis TaxID=34638 RepID=A0AAJ7L3T8_9ACAR|nr:ubiquitin carboxyl-terminal hydrolase 8 [Galendromus occidentalis]
MVVKKRLHIAHDLNALKQEVAKFKSESLKNQNVRMLQRAMPTILQKANKEFESGDEESAFVLYMRFADVGETLQKKELIGNSERNSFLEDLKKAVTRCEQLSISLRERYEQARLEKELSSCPTPPDSVLDEPIVEQKPAEPVKDHRELLAPIKPSESPMTPLVNEISSMDSVISDTQNQKGPFFVTTKDLRELLLKRQALVLDVRSPEAFADSHISISPDIINIPKVYPGVTAFTLGGALSPQASELFNRRKNFQKVVIIDWDGQDPTAPYSKPYCVSEALKKWVSSDDAITCVHLKSGYKMWTTAFPHDTTNPKPDLELNTRENSENSTKRLGQAGDVRGLSWSPESFERKVDVVPSPTLAPIVTPRISVVPQVPLKPTFVGNDTAAPAGQKSSPVPAKEPESRLAGPVPRPAAATTPSAHVSDKSDCSEISKIDKTSQDTIKQFTKAVNEKISVQKPRTFSEAEGERSDYRYPKTTLMRSRSMGDIYEESTTHRDSFSRGLEDNVEAKRPSFDRSLKPTQSLEAATVHQPVDVLQGVNNNRNNHISSRGREDNISKSSGISVAPTRIEKVKPLIPPKNRRSQSPVQAYIYGAIDRTAGLRNLRNTCYLNSVVQALAHSTEFAQSFVRREHPALRHDQKQGSLASLFARLLSQLWSQTDTRESLTLFREQVGTRCPMYRSSDQQDSHEFLMSLLTVLHEDLNEAPKNNSQSSADDPDLVVTFEMLPTKLNEFFIAHRESQRSIVTNNFEGVLLSGLKCLTCEKDSYTFQVFTVLSVPVPSSWPQLDLQACFDQFFKEETVEEWHCPHCKKKRSATKQMKIARLPKHLIIHLIRFKNEPWISSLASIRKVNNKVHFTEDLDTRDFAQYVYSKNVQLKSYTLYGIVKHHGTLSNGHYIAECRFLGKQAQPWYSYNDQEVTPLRNTIDVDNAYMLFYSCVKNS